jgi:hypothetical protein
VHRAALAERDGIERVGARAAAEVLTTAAIRPERTQRVAPAEHPCTRSRRNTFTFVDLPAVHSTCRRTSRAVGDRAAHRCARAHGRRDLIVSGVTRKQILKRARLTGVTPELHLPLPTYSHDPVAPSAPNVLHLHSKYIKNCRQRTTTNLPSTTSLLRTSTTSPNGAALLAVVIAALRRSRRARALNTRASG